MHVEPAVRADLSAIRAVYAHARQLQRHHAAPVWPVFEDESILQEVDETRLYRVMDGDALAGVFSIAYEDEAIWGELERCEHVYVHRLARAAAPAGHGILPVVLAWARAHCRALGRLAVRLDTWAENDALVAAYVRHGFQLIRRRRMGTDPRLPRHYHGTEMALLEDAGNR